jgi:hypothetical protein
VRRHQPVYIDRKKVLRTVCDVDKQDILTKQQSVYIETVFIINNDFMNVIFPTNNL